MTSKLPVSLEALLRQRHVEGERIEYKAGWNPDRAEADRSWNFPYPAIEEAVVNAVYHRSYEIREPVEVRITPEELVVLSFPGPDRSIRLEDLQSGCFVSRRYRNRRIGEFLKELDLSEGGSTGVPKIYRHMEANGSPRPVFETDEDRTFFVVRLSVHPHTLRPAGGEEPEGDSGPGAEQDAGQVAAEVTAEVAAEVTAEVAAEVTAEVTAEVESALRAVQGEMSRAELKEALGLSSDENFRLRYIVPALDAGLIERTIPDKPRSRFQRYRLSEKGRRWLAAHPSPEDP